MVFCSKERAEMFATCPGDPIHSILQEKVEKDGSVKLVVAGYENTDDIIASHADSCDINYLLKRFNSGDLAALNVRKGMYGDFTEAPKTFAEALQMQIDGKKAFYDLPTEVRAKFNNDVNKFLATAGDQEWYEKLTPPEELVKEEVKSE